MYLNNPSQSKTKIRNWTRKTSVTGKTHNGQKTCPYSFPGIYIYVCIPGSVERTTVQVPPFATRSRAAGLKTIFLTPANPRIGWRENPLGWLNKLVGRKNTLNWSSGFNMFQPVLCSNNSIYIYIYCSSTLVYHVYHWKYWNPIELAVKTSFHAHSAR